MSDVVTLSLRAPLSEPLDVEGVTADRVAGLSEREIAGLPVRLGAREGRLGDFFDVQGGRSGRMRVEGALAQVNGLGAGMAGGELVIDGDAGCRVAAGMIRISGMRRRSRPLAPERVDVAGLVQRVHA